MIPSTEHEQASRAGSDPSRASAGLVSGGVMVGVATLLATAANYLSNLVLGRWLGPEAFADAALVVSGLLLAGALALGLQLSVARAVALGEGTGRVLGLRRSAWWAGGAAGAAIVVGAPVLSSVFNTASAWPFVVFGLGLPVFLDQAVGRGLMQAGGDFARLSHSLWIEATVRLLATVVFVALGLGATGAALGLFASFVAAHAVASGVLRPISARRMRSSGRPAASPGSVRAGTSAMVVLLAGQVVIVNGDVLVIAARLPTEAGIYAAVALIGRLVFMVSWTVVTVVFPSVADPDAIDRTRLVTRAVAITAGLGAAMTAGAWLAGDTVLALMLGEAYRAGGDLLWPYALATALFSIVNLLATVDVARQRIGGPLLVLVASAVHTAALLLVAPLGAASAVWARLGLMAVLLTVAGIHWIGAERAGRRSSPVALTMDARP